MTTHMRIAHLVAAALLLGTAPLHAQLPETSVDFDPTTTALVITDPQNDFLHEDGVAWGAVGENVIANDTRNNLEALMRAARESEYQLIISPHYYYPTDHGWHFGGPLEVLMHDIGMFDRGGALTTRGFEGSGADWLERYKPYIEDGSTIVTSPHKVYGPETNDLVLQLRKRGISRVILAGMSANLCTESHLRELLEQGFEVVVVSDGTAAAQFPGLDGYAAAMANFQFIANEVVSTEDAVRRMARASR